MMKWILLVVLLAANIGFSTYTILPNLVTMRSIRTDNITYKAGDNASIERAITQASNEGIKFGRDYYGSGSFWLLGLVAVNFIILFFVVGSNSRSNENGS